MVLKVMFDPDYDLAWARIAPGVWLTITATIRAFAIAATLGILLGLGRTLQADDRTNPLVRVVKITLRNVCRAYVEFIRGIPILPLIFTVALVIIPPVTKSVGLANSVSPVWRAIIALALIYAGYIAEIIRGGVQSVDRGQIEASRSLGLSRRQTTSSIVLPQALRSVIPPLGNDFIAILKDTSLLSVLGVLEVTQRAKQFANSSFKFREGYLVLTLIYLTLTIVLSFLLHRLEQHLSKDRQAAR
jgi:polar amino acid transport system permease protein